MKEIIPAQRPMRCPETPDSIHLVENLVAPFCVIGPERTQRPGLDRAWDDLRRLYFVAFSRPENVLLMVGLTSQMGAAPRVTISSDWRLEKRGESVEHDSRSELALRSGTGSRRSDLKELEGVKCR